MLMVTQLVGFAVGAAPPVLTTISVFGSATSTSNVIAFPASIIAGDLIVFVDRASNIAFGGVPTDVTPTGFTRVGSSLSGTSPVVVGYRQNAWYKLAAGTESGNLTGMDGTGADHKAMYVFRGNVPAAMLTLGDADGTIENTNPASQSCTAGSGVAPLVVFGAYGSSGAVDPRTFSTPKGGEINPSTLLYLAYKIYDSSPANTDIDMDDEGDMNALQSFYIQMA